MNNRMFALYIFFSIPMVISLSVVAFGIWCSAKYREKVYDSFPVVPAHEFIYEIVHETMVDTPPQTKIASGVITYLIIILYTASNFL